MKRNTNSILKTQDDIEIRTSKHQFSEKTTIYIREQKSCDFISNHRLTISHSFETKLNKNCKSTLLMSDKIPQEISSKWGKITGYRTAQDVAKMPVCVLNQLSKDKRFEKLKRRSGHLEESCTSLEQDIREEAVSGIMKKGQLERRVPTENQNNLFNAEYNFSPLRNNLGRSSNLIDSIRSSVNKFVRTEDKRQVYSDNSDWETESSLDLDNPPSFPKETRNATIIPLAKLQSKKTCAPCKFCRQQNKKFQQNFNLSFEQNNSPISNAKEWEYKNDTVPENINNILSTTKDNLIPIENIDNLKSKESCISEDSALNTTDVEDFINYDEESVVDEANNHQVFQKDPKSFDSFKNFDMIPCPRNLLCDQGLHSGKCHQDVRRKLIPPVCKDDFCACRKTDSSNDLSSMLWPGHVIRYLPVSKSLESLETSVPDDCCTLTSSDMPGKNEEGTVREEERELEVFLEHENEKTADNLDDTNHSTSSTITPCCCHHHHQYQPCSYNSYPSTIPLTQSDSDSMNGINGHHHHHSSSNNHHNNADSMNGSSICGGDIITQNQQKGCWTIGLINSKFRYLTAETFGFKINANGASLKKKQIWTLEPVNGNSADSLIYLRSHLDKYLAVDSFGNVTCESDEKDPGSKFQISVADDGSGRWALKNVVRGYFLGSSADKLTCTAKVPGDAEFWHVHLAARPQMNLRSVGRKRFAHLSENLDEIHVDANIPWGEDTLFTLEFRLDESGKYAIHTCNNKYLSLGGKLVDQCTKDCLFSAEYHSGQLALRDRAGSYLSPIGSKAVLKTRSNTVTRDELFSLEDSLPQASFVANLNARFVSVKQGVDVTANQDEISDHETFQLEFDWTTKRWYIRTMQDRYWTLETGGGIQASGDKRSSNALFDLAWQQDGSVAFRANNGRYVITKRSGHLYATADTVEDNSKYYFYLINRPILVLKCEQGFVGYKSSASHKLECNKATYECIQVERGDKGAVYFKGQSGKYWHVDSEGVTADSDSREGFHLELREPTRLCIKSSGGSYLTASKNGLFRLGDPNFESATQWEY